MLNPLSPTFKEEQILEKHEEDTELAQAKDLVSLTTQTLAYLPKMLTSS